jgi:hypothetical protein
VQVITKLLYLLHQGETFTKVGAFLAAAYSGCMQHTVVADVRTTAHVNAVPVKTQLQELASSGLVAAVLEGSSTLLMDVC